MKIKSFLPLVAALFFTHAAYAGIYLEPYVSYAMGTERADFNDTNQGTGSVKGDLTGLVLGGKAGFSLLMVSFGADYMNISLNNKYKNMTSGSSGESKIKSADVGAFVGASFPKIKVSASYFPSVKSKIEETNGHTDPEGSAFKLGLGYNVLSYFAINLDYYSFSSSKATYASNNGVQAGTFDSWSSKSTLFMIGVSAPISF